MTPGTKRALWIGGGLALTAAVVGSVAMAAAQAAPASPSPGTTPGPTPAPTPTPSGPPAVGQQYTFTQGHRYQVTLVLPASIPLPPATAYGMAVDAAFPNLLTVAGVQTLPPSRLVATVDITGPTQTVDLSLIPYSGATFIVNDLGATPANSSTPNAGPAQDVTLIPGTQQKIVFAGTPVTINAPAGGTITTVHLQGMRTGPVSFNQASFSPPTNAATTLVYDFAWTDSAGTSQQTTFTLRVS